MRRSILLVMVALAMVVAAAGVALAVTMTCTSVPCKGTSAADVLRERIGDGKRDVIYGLRGADRLNAGGSLRSGPAETDVLYGGRGNDRVWAVDEDFRDKAYGGPGKHDRCLVDGCDGASGTEVRLDTVLLWVRVSTLRPLLSPLIHPSAWKMNSRQYEYEILHIGGPIERESPP